MYKRLFSLLVSLMISVIAGLAHGQPALKMMIPANPGGGWDQTARAMQRALQQSGLVRTPGVENVPIEDLDAALAASAPLRPFEFNEDNLEYVRVIVPLPPSPLSGQSAGRTTPASEFNYLI